MTYCVEKRWKDKKGCEFLDGFLKDLDRFYILVGNNTPISFEIWSQGHRKRRDECTKQGGNMG